MFFKKNKGNVIVKMLYSIRYSNYLKDIHHSRRCIIIKGRYEELDSLRGLAALSVFFGHMYLIFYENIISKLLFEYGILRFAIAGSEAVTLFFVLSGFVLSLPFYSKHQFSYSSYAIKRFCRIYIPYIVAMSIAIIFKEIFYSGKVEGLTDWFNVNWSQTINSKSLLDHVLLVGTFTSNINNVVWSLVHEMRISLIFPLIMFILVKLDFKKGIGFAMLLSLVGVVLSLFKQSPFLGTEFYYTFHCTSLFILGALLAKYRVNLINTLSNIKRKNKIILFIIGWILYLYAHPSFVLNMIVPGFDPFYRAVIDTWFTSFGASILIIFAIIPSLFSKILRFRFLNYIGKISYSLYLSHLAVLFASVHFLVGKIPIWIICVIVVVATFVISGLMYSLVEKPSIKLGKIISKFFVKRDKLQTDYHERVKTS